MNMRSKGNGCAHVYGQWHMHMWLQGHDQPAGVGRSSSIPRGHLNSPTMARVTVHIMPSSSGGCCEMSSDSCSLLQRLSVGPLQAGILATSSIEFANPCSCSTYTRAQRATSLTRFQGCALPCAALSWAWSSSLRLSHHSMPHMLLQLCGLERLCVTWSHCWLSADQGGGHMHVCTCVHGR
jgi:hypothetical protein